jgi:hypothetical protein
MRSTRVLIAGVAALIAATGLAPTRPAVAMVPSDVQVVAPVAQSTVDMSADGRYTVFDSPTTKLAVGSDARWDVFVYDRVTRTVASMSEAMPRDARYPAISADGRFVVFESNHKVWRHDVRTGVDVLASTGDAGIPGDVGTHASVSADGRFVAFLSGDISLPSVLEQVFVRDMVAGTTVAVPSVTGGWRFTAISDDGRYVASMSGTKVWRYDVRTHRFVTAPLGAGLPAWNVAISGNGRYVAFDRYLPMTDNGYGVARWDVATGTVTTLRRADSEVMQAMSDDGRYVADGRDVFDLATGRTYVVPGPCARTGIVGAVNGGWMAYSVGDPLDANRPVLRVEPVAGTRAAGYRLAAADGGVFAYGNARFLGSAATLPLRAPIVGMAATTDGRGYWLAASDGGVFAFGTARFFGSLGGVRLAAPIVGMAAPPDGRGYWLVAADGGVFAFGAVPFRGSVVSPRHKRVSAIASSGDGLGYLVLARDGTVYRFGAIEHRGSFAGARDAVAMSTVVDGSGYWVVTSGGATGRFGRLPLWKGIGGAAPTVGVAAARDACGYRVARADGSVVTRGNLPPSTASPIAGLRAPVVAIT